MSETKDFTITLQGFSDALEKYSDALGKYKASMEYLEKKFKSSSLYTMDNCTSCTHDKKHHNPDKRTKSGYGMCICHACKKYVSPWKDLGGIVPNPTFSQNIFSMPSYSTGTVFGSGSSFEINFNPIKWTDYNSSYYTPTKRSMLYTAILPDTFNLVNIESLLPVVDRGKKVRISSIETTVATPGYTKVIVYYDEL